MYIFKEVSLMMHAVLLIASHKILFFSNNLWLQELKVHFESEIHEEKKHWETKIAEYMEKSQSSIEKLRVDLVGQCTRMSAELIEKNSKESAEFQDKTRVEIESLRGEAFQMVDQLVRMWNEEKATANADLTTMKEQMKKMAEEENATAAELIEFLERSSAQLSLFSNPQACASPSALVDSHNNTRRLWNHPDPFPPVPSPLGPADAASKRQCRRT
jgi:hypothetical protein